MDDKHIGIVVQRYGKDVNGGAEVHARMIAEHLNGRYNVTVLTSRALDYKTWEPHYPPGETFENGIRIVRFDNEPRGPRKLQGYYGRKVRGRHLPQKIHRLLGYPKWWLKFFPAAEITEQDSHSWLRVQGPYMPALVDHLQNKGGDYTAFVVFTALYYPGAMSVLTVPHKCIFIPTMHDEGAAYFPIYQKVMAAPAWIFFNTKAEQEFSEQLFSISHVRKRIVGVGIDPIAGVIVPQQQYPKAAGIKGDYIIYVGRIDKAKGCDTLMDHFVQFVSETGRELQLVMVGKENMPVRRHPAIVATGFVDDGVKQQLMLQAKGLVIPSLYESLSLVLLESFACRVPVMANGNSVVLRDHIVESGGGWHYTDYAGFKKALNALLHSENEGLEKGAAGYDYVTRKYGWEQITRAFDEAIEEIGKIS